MNLDAYLIIGNNCDLKQYDFTDSYVVGIDKGAYLATKQGIALDLAVGDFDSISQEEFLATKAKKIIRLNPIKDDTDTHYALKLCKEFDKIYLLGGIQGMRVEHFIANLLLFKDYPNLVIIDDYSLIRLCDYEENFQKDEYNFYSFFAVEEVIGLSLRGFKYELNDYQLKPFDSLGVSNEVITDAYLSFKSGKLLLIKSKKE